MKKENLHRLVESALLIAVGTVLSVFPKFDMPMGGGLTVCSMLPLVLICWRYGTKWGVFSAFVYSLLQLVLGLDNVQYASSFAMALGIIFLDYIAAYTVIGFSACTRRFFKNPRLALALGIALTFTLRFLCHFVTGKWIWDALWPNEFGLSSTVYSLVYNGWYMGAELILTEAASQLLFAPLRRYFLREQD